MSEEVFTLFWHGIFSQWFKSPFAINGIVYNCCEQYMMAQKAKMFNDEEMFKSTFPSYPFEIAKQLENSEFYRMVINKTGVKKI